MTLQAEGSYAKAKAMIDTLGVMRPETQRVLDRLADVPVDIEPRFTTAEQLLRAGSLACSAGAGSGTARTGTRDSRSTPFRRRSEHESSARLRAPACPSRSGRPDILDLLQDLFAGLADGHRRCPDAGYVLRGARRAQQLLNLVLRLLVERLAVAGRL